MLQKLLTLRDQFKRQEITDRIEALPLQERTYEINLLYAQALTLLDRA